MSELAKPNWSGEMGVMMRSVGSEAEGPERSLVRKPSKMAGRRCKGEGVKAKRQRSGTDKDHFLS